MQLISAVAFLSALVFAQRETPRLVTERAQVLLLGTFHFDPSGGDEYKPQHGFDVLSKERQQQIAKLLDCLAAWMPTKIAVEQSPEDPKLNEGYRSFLELGDRYRLRPNEIHQLGFRLGKRSGHRRLYGIDAPRRFYDENLPNEYVRRRAEELGQRELIESTRKWIGWYNRLYSETDRLLPQNTLIEHLLYLNAPAQVRRDAGRYLVGEIEIGGGGDYTGADIRTAWYNRNIRIFSNILRVRSNQADRILVIIGAGHVGILRHLIENSPEIELVPVEHGLRPSPRP